MNPDTHPSNRPSVQPSSVPIPSEVPVPNAPHVPDDTIAAIATAPGEAGISIVRISGPEALGVADQVFICKGDKPSARSANTFVVGHVVDGEEVIDQAILLVMRAPHSYTGEDVVELQGHGGSMCSRRILRCVLDAGARPAEPGEFTQRAFLNGRIDLVQAEAVLDLICARSERAATAALDQLEGGLSRKFNGIYDQIMLVAGDLEATLDFPEDELPEQVLPELVRRAREAERTLESLIATWDEGHLLRDGALVVIAGRPNVGKSTLLNKLLGTARAIVSPSPGTTRDTIEEEFVVNGIPLRLVDTAGLRDSECDIEREGIDRTRAHLRRADLPIYLVSANEPLDAADKTLISSLPVGRSIIVINKIDLGNIHYKGVFAPHPVIEACLAGDFGVDEIRGVVGGLLSSRLDLGARPHATISERHRRFLAGAREDMGAACEMLGAGREDMAALASARMRSALEQIGSVTGRVYQDDLLDHIFSRFCIGK